ncbi:MAG: tetratricopeptide repeat protein [Chromatiaceae bacterium]|jgi:tetratricopeptide (TPR) repeat protein|nr:tetratricopeptide repeat protein [Chromatiaceae bacterium]
MKAAVITLLPTYLFLVALPSTAIAIAEEPAGAVTSVPVTVAPSTPAAPEETHTPALDSNGKQDPETQIQIALQHKMEGRPQEALGILQSAIKVNPDNARLYAVRGSMLLEQGRITPALSDLEKSVNLDPENAEALADRGQAYRLFGRMDLALADLDRALEIQPDLIAARLNRGAMRFEKEDFQGAIEDFDHCVTLNPRLADPYFNRALVRDARGDRDLAVNDLERFLQIEENANFRKQAQEILDHWQKSGEDEAISEHIHSSQNP